MVSLGGAGQVVWRAWSAVLAMSGQQAGNLQLEELHLALSQLTLLWITMVGGW